MRPALPLLAALLLGVAVPSLADDPPGPESPPEAKAKAKGDGKEDTPKDDEDRDPVVTHHEMTVGDATLKYTATAGVLPIRSAEGEVEARIFSVAYTRDGAGDPAERPLMFSFNGGPGSASVWLHLGALGPKRVDLPEDATIPAPPFRLVDNAATWLEATDLVFIDPVGTGYSRAAKPELNKKFHNLKGDIESVAEFIRLYLTRNGRWESPLYLVGESYGTTRAAGLSGELVDHGIALNGIVLVSSVLNFQTLDAPRGNDLPYVLYLPTFAATAWYHRQLPDDLQGRELPDLLEEVEAWASTDYAAALERGDRLTDEERATVAERLSRYTGLVEEFVREHDLRVKPGSFRKELLDDQDRSVGRFDSRYKAIEPRGGGEGPSTDASLSAVRAPYTATFNAYVRDTLGYETDRPYHVLGEGVGDWDWGLEDFGYPETSTALGDALLKNPHLGVFVASGYYDLATPYSGTEYTFAHMGLDPELRDNVRFEEYEAGHMMYVHGPSLEKLKHDVVEFLDASRRR